MAMMPFSVFLFFCGKKKVSLSSQRALDEQWLWSRQLFLPCSLSSWTLGLPFALKAGPSSMAMMPFSVFLFFCGKKKVSLSSLFSLTRIHLLQASRARVQHKPR
jgi:hypothetical protein